METIILKKAEEQTVKQKLQDVLMVISWREIARHYFGKSSSWLYHKMDGKDNDFSLQEKEQMRGALSDLADRIRRCADSL
jgi:hypothetical protein